MSYGFIFTTIPHESFQNFSFPISGKVLIKPNTNGINVETVKYSDLLMNFCSLDITNIKLQYSFY